jgi:hypothetical protein
MNLIGTVASMTHGKTMTKALPLLIGTSLFLSACADSEYGPPSSAYPVYGAVDFDYGGWGGWDGNHRWHGWRGHGFGGHPRGSWTGGGGGFGHGGRHG